MAELDEQTRKRLRPFRGLAWAVYLVVAVVFSLAITINVVRSTLAMTPERPPPSTAKLSPEECVATARALLAELDARRNALSAPPDGGAVRRADIDWTMFRIDWLVRENDAESRCVGEGPDRESMRDVFRGLDKVMDLYTTHAVQFAGEVGPTLDTLRADLNKAAPPGP